MKTERTTRHTARGGFEALDPVQLGGLSDAQRDAIIQAITAQGPSLIRQGKAQSILSRVALGGALAAAATLIFVLRSEKVEPKQEQEAPAMAAVTAPSCAADAPVTPVTEDEAGRKSIQIGSRIRALAEESTEFTVVASEPCVTRLALNEGTLTLKASDLGGGVLWLDTPHGQMRAAGSSLATGSSLRVVTLASSTTVRVVEGEVVMTRGLQGQESVKAGRAVKVGGEGVERFGLSDEERAQLLKSFDRQPEAALVEEPVQIVARKPAAVLRGARAPQPKAEPKLSGTALLAQAEALWRKGEHDAARKAFRTAAQDNGATGEAAWVRLARLELSAGSAEQALSALRARKSRSGASVLGAEALWLEAQALERAGRGVDATRAAEELLRQYPSSPQAPAARRLVAKGLTR